MTTSDRDERKYLAAIGVIEKLIADDRETIQRSINAERRLIALHREIGAKLPKGFHNEGTTLRRAMRLFLRMHTQIRDEMVKAAHACEKED